MTDAIYPYAIRRFVFPGTLGSTSSDAIDLETDTIKVCLVSAAYSYSATHEFFSSASSAVVATGITLTSKALLNNRVFDAADVTFSAVSGSVVIAAIIYKDTGSSATSPLIAYLQDRITNIPFTPLGGDVDIFWDPNGIFSI